MGLPVFGEQQGALQVYLHSRLELHSVNIFSPSLLGGDSLSFAPSPNSVLERLGEREAWELLLLKEWVRW